MPDQLNRLGRDAILQNLTVTATIVPKAGLVGTVVLPLPG